MSNSKRKSTNENTNNDGKYTILSYFSPVAKKSLSTSIGSAASPGGITNFSSPTNTPLSTCNNSNNNNHNNSITNNKFSPKTPKTTPTTANGKRKLIKSEKSKSKNHEEQTKSSSEDDEITKPDKKRRRIIQMESDDDEATDNNESGDSDSDNYVPDEKDINTTNDTDDVESEIESDIESDIKTSKSAKKKNGTKKSKALTSSSANKSIENSSIFGEKLKQITNNNVKKVTIDIDKIVERQHQELIDAPTIWLHNKLDFIKPDNIRDINKRRPNDSDYDPGTLYVPDKYLNSLTPAMRQWWELKSKNFDCVLFFKVGKFYELYHMDAETGVNELGFTFMRGEFAHSGFPEQSFDRMATSLVSRGYKVARVEQTETPDMMQERVKGQKNVSKYDKVVSREICQITNRGTQVFGQQIEITNDHQPNYMMAIAEKNLGKRSRYGICFIDTSIGDFHIGEFEDDNQCSRLLTLFSHNPPILILYEKSALSLRTTQILKTVLSHILNEQLLGESQFWSGEKTLKILSEKYYRLNNNNNIVEKCEWPSILRLMQNKDDQLGLTPLSTYSLALKSLGACLWYLTKCLIDEQILSMAHYYLYIPPDEINTVSADDLFDINSLKIENIEKSIMESKNCNRHMVVDSITLNNLKVICNDDQHSLINTLDNCCTRFGKRLLYNWICSPSYEKSIICDRQNAIKELIDNPILLQEIRLLLGALPDLERQLAQIHTFGNAKRNKYHPDGRAILFEQKQYNKKKIKDFISTINGFESLTKLPKMFSNCSTTLLKRLTQLAPIGGFPNISDTLEYFKTAFDHAEALKTGVVAPEDGVDTEYDECQKEITFINNELNVYLKEQEKYFGCHLNYFGNDKKRFQLEVPEHNAKRAGDDYILEGQKKGTKPVKRFYTDETRDLLKRMMNAEDQRSAVLKDIARRIFERFSNDYKLWKMCVDLTSILDVLTSLAIYAQNQNEVCYPEIMDNTNEPIIELENGFHPCMAMNDDFIPNGITLGRKEAPLVLLTGPNMGGKSTLMRQIGLLVIMTQIGCPIPASNFRLSLIDRIFTRLGAQDDIMAGHSTFLVELSETSAILKHATVNSLVLLDELGRGTATYDGTAIAASVVNYLADLKCRTLFSTHYHNLVDNFHKDERIKLGHMACMVENEDNDDPTQETVTFLYKYSSGSCPKSYGFNAAKLAGMPNGVIRRAHDLSKKVEADVLKRKLFTIVMENTNNTKEIKDLLIKINGWKMK